MLTSMWTSLRVIWPAHPVSWATERQTSLNTILGHIVDVESNPCRTLRSEGNDVGTFAVVKTGPEP
eukprot:3240710-Amphidinium_carterae.1